MTRINYFAKRFVFGFVVQSVVLCSLPLLAVAQSTKPAPGPTSQVPTAKSDATVPVFSLDLKSTPLRQALISLFTNARVQYSLVEDLPNSPVTLTVRDQPLDDALRLILKQGSGAQRITYTKEAGVYQIKTIPTNTAPMTWEQVQLTYLRPQDVQERLQAAFSDSTILAVKGSPDLLVRGTAEQVNDIRTMTRLMDIAPRNVVLKAEVVQVFSNGAPSLTQGKLGNGSGLRSVLLSTVLRTNNGQESTGQDKILGTAAQSAKVQLTATPTRLGDGSYELNTRWDVSLPLSTRNAAANGKPQNIIRLEKLLTNVSRIQPGQTNVIGGVILSQYGLKGEILFFVTLTEIGQPSPNP